jgi:hypothetical protein
MINAEFAESAENLKIRTSASFAHSAFITSRVLIQVIHATIRAAAAQWIVYGSRSANGAISISNGVPSSAII